MSPRPFAPGTIEAHKRPLLRIGDKARTLAEYAASFGSFWFFLDWVPAHWEQFAAFWGIK
jgi:hypothetical protein